MSENRWFAVNRLAARLKAWADGKQRRTGAPVTADELLDRAKRLQPDLTNAELDQIYQTAG